MTIANYGVWVAKPTSFQAERSDIDARSPHINLKFSDDANPSAEYSAAINVKSRDAESRLVYWLVPDLQHPFTDRLESLESGFHNIHHTSSDVLALDYIRGNLMNFSDGKLLPHDIPGPNNDIIDELVPILQSSIDSNATIYLFGSQYPRGDGIHEVHMNQGSLPRFDNGVWHDGGLVLHFPDANNGGGHWKAVFLAFASQTIHTNDQTGAALPGAKTFAQLLEAAGVGPVDDGEAPGRRQPPPTDIDSVPVAILAAIVNPVGDENQQPSRGSPEIVYLLNRTSTAISLSGWSIVNYHQLLQWLPDDIVLQPGEVKAVEVPSAPLPNSGGTISLLDSKGLKVDGVSYTRKQARKEGKVIYFRQERVPLPSLE